MKRFITTIPPVQKPESLKDGKYEAVNNKRLYCDFETCFPVLPLIRGYCSANEEIEILVIYTDDPEVCYNPELKINISSENYKRFREQLRKCLPEIHCKITEIRIKYDESVQAHLHTFAKLIEHIQEDDTLYADITFGTKPLPIVEIMALNYALRIKKNVKVECLSYGAKNFNTDALAVYDVTSLLYMDEAINSMAKMGVENPLEMIEDILKLGD